MQTLRINNSKTLGIKNTKFSGYYFYMNTNIYGDFQICVSVPLRKKRIKWQAKHLQLFQRMKHFFSKQIKLKHKLISVTISNKHPEINIDDPEIQNFFINF